MSSDASKQTCKQNILKFEGFKLVIDNKTKNIQGLILILGRDTLVDFQITRQY